MRVLHVVNSMANVGNGIVNATVDLACTQSRAGHEVVVASSGGAFVDLLRRSGVRHETISLRRAPGSMLKTLRRLRALIDEVRPDVVHAHVMTAAVLAWLLRPFVRARYGTVSTVHNEFRRDAVLMGLADRVVAVSGAVGVSMARRGIPERKIRVVNNGTLGSPRRLPAADVAAKALQRPAVTTIAGMYERKGIAELIEAFGAVSPAHGAHLYLVGAGPDEAWFRSLARTSAGHDRIHFEGFQAEPASYLVSSDVFVLASRAEPCGLVISEAREAGCAIVATAVGGNPEQLDGGAAGTLVAPRDPASLAAAIEQLLRDPGALEDARRRARSQLETFRVERVAAQTVAVYDELLALRKTVGQRATP